MLSGIRAAQPLRHKLMAHAPSIDLATEIDQLKKKLWLLEYRGEFLRNTVHNTLQGYDRPENGRDAISSWDRAVNTDHKTL